LNLTRSIAAATQRAVDFKRFTMALAEMDAAKVGALVQTALRHGASIPAIVTQIEQAIKGTYNPRFVSKRTLDISTLIYRIGGRSLLYQMNHALGLPSLRTLQHHLSFICIMPTVGNITRHTIDHNLLEVLVKPLTSIAGVLHHHGASLLIDEVAIEEAACHFRQFNKVGGLCWKHSGMVDLVLHTYHSAVNIAKQLAKGELHLGKEMTVASISFFGSGDSRTYPILAAPTCKQEDASDMAYIFETLIAGYNKVAAALLGPLWSVATDGDSTRRKAGYHLFVKKPLSPSSPTYTTLVKVLGLNLLTGEGDVTLDFDWKHVYKCRLRICTLLRSVSGIVLGPGRIINPSFLSRYLVLLDGQDADSVQKLLYPSDPQDVPRSIELMRAIVDLRSLHLDSANPNIIADLDAIRLLSDLCESILEAYINPRLSLTEQVRYLSKFAHLSFAFFRLYRNHYMSNQLYGDSQCMVKNAIFCIAKQQALDPSQLFHLFELGDDRLEKLFGRVRMLGAHDSGMRYNQGVDRLGHAVDIDGALARNPDLDSGQRRLKVTRTEALDHMNVASWEGDASVRNISLPDAWAAGCRAAEETIRQSSMPQDSANLEEILSGGLIDLLCPFGTGQFPGVDDDEPDRSIPSDTIQQPSDS
ncbi:uncharacterized protein STEHIDRAFT_25295, partial [Stereum hirsutum FP-91666 SS1]|uniref:uncharacterized protein n=1 Tax=Stereum hirsutum (strain FP-91666) TaxID=721885 RepID=UPI000444A4DC